VTPDGRVPVYVSTKFRVLRLSFLPRERDWPPHVWVWREGAPRSGDWLRDAHDRAAYDPYYLLTPRLFAYLVVWVRTHPRAGAAPHLAAVRAAANVFFTDAEKDEAVRQSQAPHDLTAPRTPPWPFAPLRVRKKRKRRVGPKTYVEEEYDLVRPLELGIPAAPEGWQGRLGTLHAAPHRPPPSQTPRGFHSSSARLWARGLRERGEPLPDWLKFFLPEGEYDPLPQLQKSRRCLPPLGEGRSRDDPATAGGPIRQNATLGQPLRDRPEDG
jgi:hypothetical protein